MVMNTSPKSRLAAALLAFFLGCFGAHRFYVGKIGTAIAQLVLTITVILSPISAVWAIVDFIMILTGSFSDKQNRLLLVWDPAAQTSATSADTTSQTHTPPTPDQH